jgi:hypothetical protein
MALSFRSMEARAHVLRKARIPSRSTARIVIVVVADAALAAANPLHPGGEGRGAPCP